MDMGRFIKKNLQKGNISIDILVDLDPTSIYRWRDSSYYNNTLAHYMGYYDKGSVLSTFFAKLEEKDLRRFIGASNSFGSTILHDAVGQNNVKLLQYIFEGVEKEVIQYFLTVFIIFKIFYKIYFVHI